MRKMMIALGMCLLLLTFLAACDPNSGSSSSLTGTWSGTNLSGTVFTYVLNADGTWSATVTGYGPWSGTYTTTSSTISLTWIIGGAGTLVYPYTLVGNTLTFDYVTLTKIA